jgi:hypothetical protein
VSLGEVPLHFLKIIDFNDMLNIPKPSLLFVHLLLDTVFAETDDLNTLREIFDNGLP